MKDQNKITGYLVKQKKIGSHVTVHFEIDEINYWSQTQKLFYLKEKLKNDILNKNDKNILNW